MEYKINLVNKRIVRVVNKPRFCQRAQMSVNLINIVIGNAHRLQNDKSVSQITTIRYTSIGECDWNRPKPQPFAGSGGLICPARITFNGEVGVRSRQWSPCVFVCV